MKVFTKVKSVGIVGIIVSALVWVLGAVWGIEVSAEVAAAMVTVGTFIAGFLTPEKVGRYA